MLIIVLGFKSHSNDSEVKCLYCGNDGDGANKAIAGVRDGEFARVARMHNPASFPVRIPSKEELAAEKAQREAAESKRVAAKEKAEADAAASAAKENPELAAKAAKEKAEADAAQSAAKSAADKAAKAEVDAKSKLK